MKRLRGYLTKKRVIWGIVAIVAVLVVGNVIAARNKAPANIKTDTVKRMDLEQTVLATGQVVSQTDLSLGFQATGVVRQVLVREGSHVGAGQTLAVLDQAAARATMTSAQGALAQAKANYDKIAAGASSEDIQVSQAAVNTAQTAVANAYSAMLNSGLAAIPASTNSSSATITVSGVYNGSSQGQYTITVYGNSFNLSGVDIDYANITRGVPIPLGKHGLYMTISSSGTLSNGDSWTVPIPNTQASTYLTNLNAYQAAQASLDQAKASLALKQAKARPEDLEVAQAQVLSAQGQVDTAAVALRNTVLSAPSPGTITKVDIKVGEQASTLAEAMVLQDVGSLHAEANVSEADIAAVSVGQDVDYTFDALGPDRHFKGTIQTVNPASTVVSGIVDYKVTASIQNAPEIRPGMTANMTVQSAQKKGVLAVVSNAVLNKDGRKYVRVVDDAKKKTYHQVEVQTGLNADGGYIEITSGLSEGQEIVTDTQG